jgi:hypothetical protein
MHGQQNIKTYISISMIINRYIFTNIVMSQDTVRYRSVSVLMNHLHAWPHLQPTWFPRLSLLKNKQKTELSIHKDGIHFKSNQINLDEK